MSSQKPGVGSFLNKSFGGERRPRTMTQIIFLTSLASLLHAGRNMAEELPRLAGSSRELKKFVPLFQRSMQISDVLRLMNFDVIPTLLAEAGERSGELGSALEMAVHRLLFLSELKGKMNQRISIAFFLLVVSVCLFFLFPLLLGDLIGDLLAEDALQIKAGFWSAVILWIQAFLTDFWWLLLSGSVAFVVFHGVIWEMIKHWPGFSVLNQFFLLKRSVLFISVFRPLYLAGIPTRDCITQMARGVGDGDKEAYQEILVKLRAGQPLSTAIDNPEQWSSELIVGFKGFEEGVDESKGKTLETMARLLELLIDLSGRRVALFAYMAGGSMAILVLMMQIFGIVFPLQSLRGA